MKNRFSISRVHAATVLAAMALPVLALPTAAFAQATPPASPGMSSNMAPQQPGAASTMTKSLSEKVKQHIARLHTQLGITTAEEPQWEQFAQVMRDNSAQMEQAFKERGETIGKMNAVEDMQSYAHLAQIHAANMQQLASAFKVLYDTFPDSQKKVADEVFRTDGRRGPVKH
ncbi:MAG TPA: Spy/CpxP family protein refolding chaperone [Acidocella sp.]|nr:Spy/CpxP family protein refolding chaperone [Acidocella sp.]